MNFYERYCALCAGRGLKPHSRKTAELIGISNALVTAWKKGTKPTSATLEKLSAFFNVSTDYLLYGSDGNKAEELINNDPELTEFLEMLSSREECRMLFHLSKDAKKEDVELAAKIIEELRRRGD
jgi:transcriptional regulator with XRE-family HTH domain